MVLPLPNFPSTRLLLGLASAASEHVPHLRSSPDGDPSMHTVSLARRDPEKHDPKFIAFACFIPVLVILSGLFSGLTLGYMSLDETQLKVLSISGTPQQKKYAEKIKPIRQNGHLLLVTLLLANMIVNETLPVISDPVLGGGVQSVVVSTVLIVIFAEIIPQSLCTRYGLYFGAKLAGFVRVLILLLGIVAWPVSKLLEFALGPHHGIIYRRAELKELIAMHSNGAELGGDLKIDTVTIIGGALDLQEKVVRQAMTPIKDVFMLSIDAKLDYETLRKICQTGHSRIPVYEEVDIPVPKLVAKVNISEADLVTTPSRLSLDGRQQLTQRVKKIIGILLVKQCVLLDPNDATPVRNIPLNKVPFVPNNEPLLGILDKFQEGRSHMAIVSRFSVERAASVKQAVKRGLTQRLRDRVLSGDSDSSSSSEEDELHSKPHKKRSKKLNRSSSDNDKTLKDDAPADVVVDDIPIPHVGKGVRGRNKVKDSDLEMGIIEVGGQGSKKRMHPLTTVGGWGRWEQSMPADAVLTKEGVDEFLQSVDPAIMPVGIITLEDVLEELIGEEIYDEFDPQGHPDLSSYVQAEVKLFHPIKRTGSAPQLVAPDPVAVASGAPAPKSSSTSSAVNAFRNLNFKVPGFQRPKSTPPTPRDGTGVREKEKTQDGPPPPSTATGGVVAPHTISSVGNASQPSASMDVSEKPVQVTVSGEAPSHPAVSTPTVVVVPAPVSAAVIPPESVLAAANKARTSSGPQSVPGGAPCGAPVIPISPTLLAPVSRSTSPAPSLEQAILVERKRRAASSSGSQNAIKGGWFKSSPLNGEERHGVIVAERVKQAQVGGAAVKDDEQQMPQSSREGASEPKSVDQGEVFTSDEKDNVVLDKE